MIVPRMSGSQKLQHTTINDFIQTKNSKVEPNPSCPHVGWGGDVLSGFSVLANQQIANGASRMLRLQSRETLQPVQQKVVRGATLPIDRLQELCPRPLGVAFPLFHSSPPLLSLCLCSTNRKQKSGVFPQPWRPPARVARITDNYTKKCLVPVTLPVQGSMVLVKQNVVPLQHKNVACAAEYSWAALLDKTVS